MYSLCYFDLKVILDYEHTMFLFIMKRSVLECFEVRHWLAFLLFTYLFTCRGTSIGPAGASQEVSASGCSPHPHPDSNTDSNYVGVTISALIFL
jgi:hypothetical protein